MGKEFEAGFKPRGTLEAALKDYGLPEIFNSAQGSQFTHEEFISRLKAEEPVKISLDSRGRAYDNIFAERLRWSVKYETIFPHEYQDIPACKGSPERYFSFYNT